jgi:hypothetical protein
MNLMVNVILIEKIEFKLNLIVAKLELEPEPCDLETRHGSSLELLFTSEDFVGKL